MEAYHKSVIDLQHFPQSLKQAVISPLLIPEKNDVASYSLISDLAFLNDLAALDPFQAELQNSFSWLSPLEYRQELWFFIALPWFIIILQYFILCHLVEAFEGKD